MKKKKPMYRQEILFETDEGDEKSFQMEYIENEKEFFKSGFESELKRNGWKLGKIIKDSGIYLHVEAKQ